MLAPMSLALCLTYQESGVIVVKPYDNARIICVVVLGIMLWKAMSRHYSVMVTPRTRLFEMLAALAVSMIFTIGQPISDSGVLVFSKIIFAQSVEYQITKSVSLLVLLIALIGNTVWIWTLISLLFGKLDEYSSGNVLGISCKSIGIPLVVLILLLCWMPYIVIWFPGAITSDQSNQLAQFFGYGDVPLTDRFPFFVGIVFSSLYKIGNCVDSSGITGIFLISLLQIFVSLFVCVTILRWIYILSQSRLIRVFSVAFFALFPLVPIYTISVGKDGLHAFLLALFCMQLFLFLESKQRSLPESKIYTPWAISIVALLVVLTRNNGIFLAVPSLLVLAPITKKREIINIVGIILVASIVWMRVLVPSFGVANFGSREVLSIPAQIVGANLSAGQKIDGNTKSILENSYSASLKKVGASYVPDISDPSKGLLAVDEEDRSSTMSYCMAAFTVFREHPLTSIVAVFRTTMNMYPATPGTYWYEDCPYFCDPHDSFAAAGWCPSAKSLYEKDGSKLNTTFRNALYILHRSFPLSVLYTPGTYFILLVILYCYTFSKNRIRVGIVCSALPLVFLETVLFAAPCGSIRYALPLIFSLPFVLMLFEYAKNIEG